MAANITLKDEGRSSSLLTRSQRKERFAGLFAVAIQLTAVAISCENLEQLNQELDAAEEALQLAMDEKSDLEEEISSLDAESTHWKASAPSQRPGLHRLRQLVAGRA